MAKFGRYDPRNKKKDRNKNNSINKELRFRRVEQTKIEKYGERLLKEITYDDEEVQQLRG